MRKLPNILSGLAAAALLAWLSYILRDMLPGHLIGAPVIALLLGMLLNPWTSRWSFLEAGLSFTAKKILRLAIILMGATLSFAQVIQVGRLSLMVMAFTLVAAFGGGYLFGKLFKMDWKLSGLISAGTGICGGSAIAAVAPVIEADESYVAYAISATFIFDVLMVILFPLMGRYFGMSDLGFGLWTGTAVNDTSSVAAASLAFSEAAGNYAIIVKLTRTLAIVPVVLAFSLIKQRVQPAASGGKVSLKAVFPWFILMFLGLAVLKSTGFIPTSVSQGITGVTRFMLVMALGAIGLKTNFSKLAKSGLLPLLHGFIISSLVVAVAYVVQLLLGQV